MDNSPAQKAKEYAFLLLKFRQRSEKEVYQRLKSKKFDQKVIKETLAFLKAKDFIDDKLFAKAWIESRLKKPLGLRRIRQELNLKGIDKEIINSYIEKVKEKYPEEEIVWEIVKKRLGRLSGIDPDSVKRRIYSYLLRRGFSAEIVSDVITRICKHTS